MFEQGLAQVTRTHQAVCYRVQQETLFRSELQAL